MFDQTIGLSVDIGAVGIQDVKENRQSTVRSDVERQLARR